MKHSVKPARRTLVLLGLACFSTGVISTAHAGSAHLGDGWSLDYIIDLTYSAAIRTEDSDSALTGNVNGDDGDRNFDSGSLINNRAAALAEANFSRGRFGALVRGSAFLDRAYVHNENDNQSPATVNKSGPANRFSNDAVDRLGRRARLLDAYVYGAWTIGSTDLSIRAGNQVVSWGESLFFPNMSGAQAPADATKSNVPGTEVKEVLLPAGQVYLQWGLTNALSVSGYYQYDYKQTELNPVGAYFSSTDLVGPGAEFFILNLPPSLPVSRVEIPKREDVEPESDTQWGVRTKYQIGIGTTLALHYIEYHAKNPTGARFRNTAPADVLGGKSYYQVVYADDIKMTDISLSTDVAGVAVGAEVSYRDGVGVNVDAPGLFGALQPTPTTADVWQANLSAIKVVSQSPLWDQLTLLGEVSGTSVDDVDPLTIGGAGYSEISNTNKAAAFQGTAIFSYKQVFEGWNMSLALSHANAFAGTTAVAATLGSLTGDGDRRYNVTLGFEYLQNLKFAVGYNYFEGDADSGVNALADRNFATFSAKYSF